MSLKHCILALMSSACFLRNEDMSFLSGLYKARLRSKSFAVSSIFLGIPKALHRYSRKAARISSVIISLQTDFFRGAIIELRWNIKKKYVILVYFLK